MSQRNSIKTTFEPSQVIEPIYTGGDVALSQDGQFMVSCLGEDVVSTNPQNGRRLARVEGVSFVHPHELWHRLKQIDQ